MAAVATQWAPAPATLAHKRSSSSAPSNRCNDERTSTSKHADMYDRFYGHRQISELSEAVISALFACPLDSTSSSVNTDVVDGQSQQRPTPRLAEFIAYALHRTRLPDEITFQALFLLRRLKSRFPAARGSSGHRLFISALMLASKSSCDDTYSNKSWTIVSQGLFSLREVNQMERELFGYLGFKVNVEYEELYAFTSLLEHGDIAAVIDFSNGTQMPNMLASPALPDKMDESSPYVDVVPPQASPNAPPAVVQAPAMTRHHSAQNQLRSSMSSSSYPRMSASATVSPSNAISAMASASAPSVCNVRAPSYVSNPIAAPLYGHTTTSMHRLSPSMASMASRGSVSSTASGYSLTPSPTAMSQSGESSCNSSRTSPDTPPSDFDASPWTDDGKGTFVGQPAGTYDDQYRLYQQQIKQTSHQQFFAAQQVYLSNMGHGQSY